MEIQDGNLLERMKAHSISYILQLFTSAKHEIIDFKSLMQAEINQMEKLDRLNMEVRRYILPGPEMFLKSIRNKCNSCPFEPDEIFCITFLCFTLCSIIKFVN